MGEQCRVVSIDGAPLKRSELSAQVSHLESAIVRLKAFVSQGEEQDGERSFPRTAAAIKGIVRARRMRETIFGTDLFFDPAWDMLLEAYAVHLAQGRISVSGLCFSSAVPQTTALRWLKKLEQDGWLLRENDKSDARRQWLSLSDAALASLNEYFSKLAKEALPV